ncbi:NF038129 family PEP-CTERM protein [Massilia sp. HP4]|uniref:NF038129 family PEP-CTERM protein n=1 Tax=Massilia sp. HP4 TaxID=2562316 RepID=UPI0010C0D683|nr:NF038129 family PEP-CTERM protein [Massilia sp. HP4]
MFNAFNAAIHAFLARAMVALLLATAAGATLAGPVYRVSIDTGSWSGSGYLNLTLTGLDNATPITATVSNFKGSFGSERFTQGQVSGDVGSLLSLVQGPSFNELLQRIDFGGIFSFDVRFGIPAGSLDGSNFGVALVDAGRTAYAPGTSGDIAAIALMPGAADASWAAQGIASITEVPEPGSAAIVALGLLLAGCCRARNRPGRVTV